MRSARWAAGGRFAWPLAPHDAPVAGAQLLLRRIPLLGWSLAYVPRGPIGHLDEPVVRDALGSGRSARSGRDEGSPPSVPIPRLPPSTAFGGALLEAPWRAALKVQPPTTRVIDLTLGEEALRANLKRKHRQYVNKAERAGIEVERFDGSTLPEVIAPALDDFNRIYRLTADRAGFVARQPFYYERVWSVFAPTGRVRLRSPARTASGSPRCSTSPVASAWSSPTAA